MQIQSEKIQHKDLLKHETKQHVFIKFLLILLIFVGYFVFIATQYGLQNGLLVTALTWSFFVLCTPVADAGFLLDFPFRLISHIRMLFSEIVVWIIAITLNIYTFFLNPAIYDTTPLLRLFQHILEQPIPFWSIILISALGTFISIKFGDELLDKASHTERSLYNKHQHTHKFIIMIFIIFLSLVIYDLLLKQLGIALPL